MLLVKPGSKAKKTIVQAFLDLSVRLPVGDKGVSDRLNRAERILMGYGYNVTKGEDGYVVSKLSTGIMTSADDAVYNVTNSSCTCPDFETARGNLCKHRLAIMLIEEMEWT